jgi:hypothetical protein
MTNNKAANAATTPAECYSVIMDIEEKLTLLESFGELLTALSTADSVTIDKGCSLPLGNLQDGV